MGQDRDEDLHVGLAAPGAKGERLAGEVRHSVQPGLVVEVHLRRAAAVALVRLQARAELAIAVRLPALGPGLVAVLLPKRAARRAHPAPLALGSKLTEHIIPVRLRIPALSRRRRIQLRAQPVIVEIGRQRP